MDALGKKLFWLAFWVVGFAVFTTCLLLYFKYQSVFSGLQRDRVLMVASEIDDIAEKNLSLGQDFWEIATLQDVIERRREADTIFIGIDVVGVEGKIAYSTEPTRIGTVIAPDWLGRFSRTAKVSSLSPSTNLAVVASPIFNSFNLRAGYAVIRYDRAVEHQAMAQFTQRLLFVGLGVFVAFTLILFLILFKLKNNVEKALLIATTMTEAGIAEPLSDLHHQRHAASNTLAEEMTVINVQETRARQALAAVAGVDLHAGKNGAAGQSAF